MTGALPCEACDAFDPTREVFPLSTLPRLAVGQGIRLLCPSQGLEIWRYGKSFSQSSLARKPGLEARRAPTTRSIGRFVSS